MRWCCALVCALATVLAHTDTGAERPGGLAVLDAGSARYSPVLPWLRLAADRCEQVVNQPTLRGPARDHGFKDVRVSDSLGSANR